MIGGYLGERGRGSLGSKVPCGSTLSDDTGDYSRGCLTACASRRVRSCTRGATQRLGAIGLPGDGPGSPRGRARLPEPSGRRTLRGRKGAAAAR